MTALNGGESIVAIAVPSRGPGHVKLGIIVAIHQIPRIVLEALPLRVRVPVCVPRGLLVYDDLIIKKLAASTAPVGAAGRGETSTAACPP